MLKSNNMFIYKLLLVLEMYCLLVEVQNEQKISNIYDTCRRENQEKLFENFRIKSWVNG